MMGIAALHPSYFPLIDVNMLSATELKWLNDYHERVNRAVRPHLDDNATKLWLDEATAALLPL
ncbi:M24 family metallopeptidase C-terminal domain-containing protein [Bradyrhizobium sp. WSM 1738]|nr:M24 family metallopeptidase C-terminal domain-containing protein [Bradyrhizobium hereditatis]